VRRRRVARWILREHRVHPGDDPRRQVGPHVGERRRLVVELAHQQRHRRVGVMERMPAREHLVRDQAGRVEVDLRGDLATADLLGRNVCRGADDLARRGAEVGHADLPDRLGDPEVGDLCVAVRRDEHVLGLEIAVHDALRGRLGQTAEDAVEHARDLGEREPPDERAQRAALEVLHRDERHALVLEVLDHRHHARVIERAPDARLVEEAPRERRVGDVGGMQLLQGDLAVERRLPGEMHGGHPAPAQQAVDLVAAGNTGRFGRHASGGHPAGRFIPRRAVLRSTPNHRRRSACPKSSCSPQWSLPPTSRT
jgi:hypothetical protein